MPIVWPAVVRSGYESAPQLLVIGVGGAIGAGARWAIDELGGVAWGDTPVGAWPWPTLFVNLLGCALIGLAAAFVDPGSTRWSFVVTGALGGFTTYSAFAVEVDQLANAGRPALAGLYVGTTLLGGAVATLAGARRAVEPPVPRRSIE
ncbi:MAG: CrcB family protein [Actinomycetota bacterium]